MSALPGRRAGLAIVRVEAEDATPERLVIRVLTVDDVMAADAGGEPRAFGDAGAASAHLAAWLERWPSDGATEEGTA